MSAIARMPADVARHDLTPRATVLLSALALAGITALDVGRGELGAIFTTGYVLIVATAPVAVQYRGLFATGIMPPVLLIGALFFVSWLAPEAIVIDKMPDSTGLFGRTLSATIDNGVALLVGHALAIISLLLRMWVEPAPNSHRL